MGDERDTATTGPAAVASGKARATPQAPWARTFQRHLNGLRGVVAGAIAVAALAVGGWLYLKSQLSVEETSGLSTILGLAISPESTGASIGSSEADSPPSSRPPSCTAILFVPLATAKGTIDPKRGKLAADFRVALEGDGASVLRTEKVNWGKFSGVRLDIDWSVGTDEECLERQGDVVRSFTTQLRLQWPEPTRKRGQQYILSDVDTMPPRLRLRGEDVYSEVMRRVRAGSQGPGLLSRR